MFFQIFNQIILPAELIVIFEMVNLLMGCQLLLVQIRNKLFLAPNDIPLIIVNFAVPPLIEGIEYTIREVRPEFDDRPE